MPRIAFRLKIKAGKEQEYDEAHRQVWPALLEKLKEVGISNYSIFRRDQDLVLVMEVDDFEAAWKKLDQDRRIRDGKSTWRRCLTWLQI
jgi:L-rhamnose mutarotase